MQSLVEKNKSIIPIVVLIGLDLFFLLIHNPALSVLLLITLALYVFVETSRVGKKFDYFGGLEKLLKKPAVTILVLLPAVVALYYLDFRLSFASLIGNLIVVYLTQLIMKKEIKLW